jgi:DNA-binding MarR family transcriptional regulator
MTGENTQRQSRPNPTSIEPTGDSPTTESGPITQFDVESLTTWQDELDAHLDKLPDSELAEELKAEYRARSRARLRVGDTPPLALFSADQILNTDWPEPVWAVPGLLPAGLCILAGKPKVGKSWLALQIAQAVAAGGVVLGQRVKPGPVLYLALEDPPQRLKARMRTQNWPHGLPAEFMPIGEFAMQIGNLRNGGGEKLAQQIRQKGYRLVVLDTLSRSVFGDQMDVAQMTRALSPIQEMALTHNCATLMLDHHHKLAGADAMADILGSTAKGAVADTGWGLYRGNGQARPKLVVVGRDIAEKTLELTFDLLTCCWQVVDEVGALKITPRRREILVALDAIGKAQVDDVAQEVGQERGNTFKRLQDLANAGYVARREEDENVFYDLTKQGQECLRAAGDK